VGVLGAENLLEPKRGYSKEKSHRGECSTGGELRASEGMTGVMDSNWSIKKDVREEKRKQPWD